MRVIHNCNHSLVEEAVLNPGALPECMRGMRRYRIEYGGHAEDCVMEQLIYLPPEVDPDLIEQLLNPHMYVTIEGDHYDYED